MVSTNPFAEFRVQCEAALEKALTKLYPKVAVASFVFEFPPTREFGQLASSLCFELSREMEKKPLQLAEELVGEIRLDNYSLIREVKAAGGGYINFYVDFARLSALTIESVKTLNSEYGYVKTDSPQKIIVEHTSVNPLHPIHIGQARNPVLGDAIARMLEARGHEVSRHYYVDDVGRQTAVNAYGYEKLGRPKPKGKPDHFFGRIYTITSCLIEIHRLKGEIEKIRENSALREESLKLQRQLDDWMSIAAGLKNRFPKLFDKLLENIRKDENPEFQVNSLNRAYEAGSNEHVKQLVRGICELCLEGFKETLERMEIFFDSWDWESDFVWSGEVTKVLEKLKQTPYVHFIGGTMEFNAEKVAEDLGLKKMFGLNEDYEIPSLTLVRADGTTLYTTRDVAYSLWKFQKADKLVNVIGMEQTLAQLQLKLILCALGYRKNAENLMHMAYNLVRLPGYKMSSRRGRYITLDQVMDEAVQRAYEEVSKRSPHLSEREKKHIAEFVGIGALKYALVEVDPSKPVVFTWDRVLNFERNSAPYLQYSHARACSIIRKAAREPSHADYSLLTEPIEQDIILMLARFPETFIEAVENLKPNMIAEFANALADKFNTFYNALPVIRAEPLELSDARLALVDAVRKVLRNALNLIGIEGPERM